MALSDDTPAAERQADIRRGSRHVIDAADADLPLLYGLEDGLDERRRGLPGRELGDTQRLGVDLINLRTGLELPPRSPSL